MEGGYFSAGSGAGAGAGSGSGAGAGSVAEEGSLLYMLCALGPGEGDPSARGEGVVAAAQNQTSAFLLLGLNLTVRRFYDCGGRAMERAKGGRGRARGR